MTPEGKVKAMVKTALQRAYGDECYRFMPVQTGYGSPGLDFHLCIRGRAVFIETKVPGKKLTPQQEATRAAMQQAGGLVFVIYDGESLQAAMEILRNVV